MIEKCGGGQINVQRAQGYIFRRASQSGNTLEALEQQLEAILFHKPIPKVKLYCAFN